MANTLILPAILDLKAAAQLKQDVDQHRGSDLQVDASEVQRLGALCLQVLLAARAAWSKDKIAFAIEPQSDPFSDALRLFGATHRIPRSEAQGEAF